MYHIVYYTEYVDDIRKNGIKYNKFYVLLI